jgi:hypothetical protein
MKMRVLIGMTVMAVGMLSLPPARATTMVSLSLEQLTQASSVIVQARMTGQVVRVNDARTSFITVSTWEVSQTFKGSPGSTLEIEQPGGTMGRVSVYVSGVTLFKPQTDYVLFLEPTADGARFRPVGMQQGAFRVYDDAVTQERRVILPFTALQLHKQVLASGNPAGTVPLQSFTHSVTIAKNEPIKIPSGISMPVTIVSTEAAGAGRMLVSGRTTTQLFPSKSLVIPAGTEVQGHAVLAGGSWTIRWTDVNVRGVYAPISGTSQEAEGSLRGKSVVLSVK